MAPEMSDEDDLIFTGPKLVGTHKLVSEERFAQLTADSRSLERVRGMVELWRKRDRDNVGTPGFNNLKGRTDELEREIGGGE